MWLDRVSKPGPLAHESDVLPTALCSLAYTILVFLSELGLIGEWVYLHVF